MIALTLESSPVALKNLRKGKKKKKSKRQPLAWNPSAGAKERLRLTCLLGGGRVSLGGFWAWAGGRGGVSWRLGLVTEEDVELQRDRLEYPVRGW